jgi:hypothetical protein
MITTADIHHRPGRHAQGLASGGLDALLPVARRTGSIAAIDHRLHLLRRRLPYHESDHILDIAPNLLAGGRCLEHIERLRTDEVHLDAPGARRIPDPTAEADSCRRSHEPDARDLMRAINGARLHACARQPADSFAEATVDGDGTPGATGAECKGGADIAHDGTRGYHPPPVTPARAGEPLSPVDRSGDRPSHEGAHTSIDGAIALCRKAGFRRISPRGDTDFSQAAYLDRREAIEGVRFVFGTGNNEAPIAGAAGLPAEAYSSPERPPK